MFTEELLDELNILLRYNLESTLAGIKIHHDAEPVVIEAVKRLHDKGLVSLPDGGYLTELGRAAAEHAHACHAILTSG